MLSLQKGFGSEQLEHCSFKDRFVECQTEIDSIWDDDWYQKSLIARISTDHRDYEIKGEIESLIPLRNQRTTPDGEQLLTRITEGLTLYECDGMTGWGMSEYLDQIVDGIPIGAV